MVKVESILKWKLEGPVLKKIKLMRSQILSKNEDAVALPDSDLHVTLASGPGWKEIRRQAKSDDFDEPEFKIDIEPTFKVMEQGGRKSWYVRMKDQRNWKEYVMDLLQGTHDARRVYHITIANLTGKTGDSIAMVEERDYKDEYKKFQSSKKMKKYRAELNRYNRRKGNYGNGDGKDASHKKGKIVGYEDESTNRGRAEKSRLKGSIREDISKSDLDQIEKYADKLFAAVGIDVEFTRHFLDRANDERNKKPISTAELIGLFKKTYKKHGKKIPALGPDAEAVIKDMRTDINVPFVLNIDRDGMLDLVAKTVMRKQNFKTTNMELPV
tara:strand:- start:87 stop:1067 length:981 start_codon:yes stop_codon:yes gene_type:complete